MPNRQVPKRYKPMPHRSRQYTPTPAERLDHAAKLAETSAIVLVALATLARIFEKPR